ncbi:hypothetical protein HWV62_15311 [Athelia sp. TMB]|nr:hypothetical protein HWV62_15311 [Athelia sp. TMB]
MSLIESTLFCLKSTTYGGRSLFATIFIPANSLVHASESPCAHVIYKDYRKTVSSDSGANSKHKSGTGNGERFCTIICKDLWIAEGMKYNGVRGKVSNAVEAAVRRMHRERHKSISSSELSPGLDPEVASTITQEILDTAWIAAVNQEDGPIAQLNDMELEIMRFVSSGLVQLLLLRNQLAAAVPDALELPVIQANQLKQSALNLQENELPHIQQRPYILESHIRIHSFLRSAIALGRRDSDDMFGKEPTAESKAGGWVRGILGRDAGNAFGIRQDSSSAASVGGSDLEDDEMMGWGLWVDASYFNHSCNPNIKKVRVGRTLQFYTTAAIQPGEELCISYVDLDSVEDADTSSAEQTNKGGEAQVGETRRQLLMSGWFFACECPRCQSDQT